MSITSAERISSKLSMIPRQETRRGKSLRVSGPESRISTQDRAGSRMAFTTWKRKAEMKRGEKEREGKEERFAQICQGLRDITCGP